MKLDDFKARCGHCEECDTHWNWKSTFHPSGVPIMKSKGKTIYPRRALWEMKHGKPVPAGKCIVTICRNPKCCNPELLRDFTKRQVLQRTAESGAFSTATFRAKVAEGRRKNSKLSDEAVEEIRVGHAPEMAAKHGISATYARMIQRGEFRKDYRDNPFAGLLR